MKIAYLAPEIPALSATFVYNEILQLEKLGTEVLPFSVHKPFSAATDPQLNSLKKKVVYVYEYSKLSALLSHLRILFKHPLNYLITISVLLSDIINQRIFTRNALGLVFRFFYAGRMADDLIQNQCRHLHVHFAHVPTDIAMYAASLSGISFSVMAHANDLFERGSLLSQKVERSAFFATISEFNIRYLSSKNIDTTNVCIVRCGVNSEQFTQRGNFIPNQPVKIGVVGRLVEKKGIDTLIKAVAILKEQQLNIELLIAGSGPLESSLSELVKACNLSQNDVTFLGAMPHTQVGKFIKSLDAFVLPCKQDINGDMDGIPVVLMEAMISAVPVISTVLSGIPELVINEDTGLLVQPDDEQQLATAIATIVNDNDLRESMIEHAIAKVESEFSLNGNTKRLNTLFSDAINDSNK